MWFESIVRTETGCAAYVVGATDSGECAVVDPLWAIDPYLQAAARRGARIRYVIDTHSHADHVSGARRLVRAAGAELVLHELAEVAYEATRVRDGDRLRLGEVSLDVLHVPGHRPEQINVVVTDHSRSDDPWCMLTADFLLVGDVARPDLAQSGEDGARTLFDVSLPRLRDLPDFVEVYPGHVAGST
jgi:glyoxylase-like metal-dependent hydrolase (beta-lactamase superfamily II)